jgi:hypothetical protein
MDAAAKSLEMADLFRDSSEEPATRRSRRVTGKQSLSLEQAMQEGERRTGMALSSQPSTITDRQAVSPQQTNHRERYFVDSLSQHTINSKFGRTYCVSMSSPRVVEQVSS